MKLLSINQLFIFLIVAMAASPAAAMMNPQLGRFMQRDPAGYVDGPNTYQCLKSQPLRYVDPSGLSTDCDQFVDSLVDIAQRKNSRWSGPDVIQRSRAGADIAGYTLPGNSGNEMIGKAAFGGFGGTSQGDLPSGHSGFREKLTQGRQNRGVYRHVGASAAASLQGADWISRTQDWLDKKQYATDPNKSLEEHEAELEGNKKGREAGEHIESFIDDEISAQELRDRLIDELCCPDRHKA